MQLTVIEWVDSHALNNWDSVKDYIDHAKSRKTIISVGLLIDQTKEYFLLVQSIGNEQVDNGIIIYKRSVVNVTQTDIDLKKKVKAKVSEKVVYEAKKKATKPTKKKK